MKIDQYLQSALQSNASDLHFVSGDPVRARIHGSLQVIDEEPLSIDTVRECMLEIMDGTTKRDFEQDDAADFAETTARELASVGINMNMAPVMDVDHEGIDGVMAKRAFGSDPDRVCRLGCAVIETLQQNGIMAEPDKVRELIEELAAGYEDKEQVINYYYGNFIIHNSPYCSRGMYILAVNRPSDFS